MNTLCSRPNDPWLFEKQTSQYDTFKFSQSPPSDTLSDDSTSTSLSSEASDIIEPKKKKLNPKDSFEFDEIESPKVVRYKFLDELLNKITFNKPLLKKTTSIKLAQKEIKPVSSIKPIEQIYSSKIEIETTLKPVLVKQTSFKSIVKKNLEESHGNLETVLSDSSLLPYFERFMKEKYRSVELLDFYSMVQIYKKINNDLQRTKVGISIYQKFLEIQAPSQINVAGDEAFKIVVKTITPFLTYRLETHSPTKVDPKLEYISPDIFDRCSRIAINLLRSNYFSGEDKFVNSKQFDEFVEEKLKLYKDEKY